ncbi:dTDP-4-dehydrorhamnose 3,5-epimerase family protein [Thioalkalivibrio sp. XN279]|uniref:dTDP-4-dehydrorhamnose 3,5-epimerase family protein n=1 Tax=Thioalkalivibrio sp. XN279 TaxID=2714953 RepID=UPI00140C572B|nr:dTDP-4-dehydrorhamnose 3,5-epimerase [Thioalkalivibrio sp. XN279]NHA16054.1 dTDP-4-keto-6-deoxy-D-glucose epimerase [Thioalkalivibrio sp. XN279]
MRRFTLANTPLAGLSLLTRHPIGDQRGRLDRLFCRAELADLLKGRGIEQINHTLTVKAGTVRGMHFQYPPHAEMKLVTCVKGEVFDVAVDLRWRSPSFLCWHAERLSATNRRTLVIPEGFAHGFQTLADDCEVFYLHTAAYHSDAEGALNALDPRLGIAWPLPVGDRSDRDQTHPFLDEFFMGVDVL